jgi:CheY-like chemotaxis protein
VSLTVLIVDDHAGFRSLARALLEAEGFQIVGEAEDAASALSAAGRFRPQVVLLDIQLPDLDGFEVAERLAQAGDPPAVVLVSTRAVSSYRRRLAGSPVRGLVSLGYAYAAMVPLARNDVVTIVVVVLVLATTIRGYATAAGPDRLARVTAVAAAAAVALPLAGGSTGRLLGAGPDAERAVLWGYQVVLVLIAVGLLVDLLRGRWARAVVTRLVVDLGERAETGTLQARLAHALGDRSLAIAYWLPEANGYVDERGDRVVLPGAGSGRAVTVIEQRGERIAALVHDAAVLDDPALVDAVASAARIALSNVRLQAEVRRQVAELAASRRRILEASDAQRRHPQQELRVGVERRLAGVGEQLERTLQAAGSAADSAAAAGLGDARRELDQAQVELQELAAGIHPALLTEQGLGAALSSLAERAPVPVRLVVPPQPYPPRSRRRCISSARRL